MGGAASTGGGGGGVGPAGKKKDGTYGTKKDAKKTSSRNEGRKAVTEFIKGGGVTGAIIKSIVDIPKKNKKSKSGDVYGGKTAGYNEAKEKIDYKAPTKPIGGNDGDNQKTVLASTPKKVIDTVDGKQEGVLKVKDTNVASTAPTKAEVSQAQATDMSSDQILVANKKKGRSQTILNKAKGLGDTKATIFKRTLGA